jgi:hypothetical protein
LNVFFVAAGPDKLIIINTHLSEIETLNKYKQDLELKTNDSTSNSSTVKVEIITISGPGPSDPGDNSHSYLYHLINIYSRKKYSLISHSNLIISKTLHLSPLITRLQI